MFDDTTLTATTTHAYIYALNRRFGRPAPEQPPRRSRPGPWTVHLTFDALHKRRRRRPVVIWRNPRVVLRTPAPPPDPFEPAAITRARVPGPILKTLPAARGAACQEVVAR